MPEKQKNKKKILKKNSPDELSRLLKIFAIIVMLAMEVTFITLGIVLQTTKRSEQENNGQTEQSGFTNQKKDDTIQKSVVTEEEKEEASEAKDKDIPPSLYCRTDADCAPIFATCSCSYACVNPRQYGNIKHVTCSNVCTDQDVQNTVNCLCRNNTCTKN